MAKIDARGAKRRCQNEECLASFYDLNREEFSCPNCDTKFDHKAHAKAQEQSLSYATRKRPRVLPITAPEGQEAKPTGSTAVSEPTIGDPADVVLEVEDDDVQAEIKPLGSAINDQQ